MKLHLLLPVVASLVMPAVARAADCASDAECGDTTSGRVCVDAQCTDGCRGEMGNECPADRTCSSVNAVVGTCTPIDQRPYGTGIVDDPNGVYVEGDGDCSFSPPGGRRAGWLFLASPLVLGLRRRARAR